MRRNIDSKGRAVRGAAAAVLFGVAGAGWFLQWPVWALVVLVVAGLFAALEAAAGWCALRACGIKTRF
jgi:hypothetical protein